jgi:3-deoxy-manno-octulosonate cytidylyltransferase (CMP-KDO synthetase)
LIPVLLEQTKLEAVESIDMMRIIEHGIILPMVTTLHDTQVIDTPVDSQKLPRLMQDMDA